MGDSSRYTICRRFATSISLSLMLLCNRVSLADNAQTVAVKYSRGETQFDTLGDGVKYFANKDYPLHQIPAPATGMMFTRRPYGNARAVSVEINAPAGSTVFLLVDSNQNKTDSARCPDLIDKLATSGWANLGDAWYTMRGGPRYESVFTQHFAIAKTFTLTGGGISGIAVAAASLKSEAEIGGDKKPDGPAPVITLRADPSPDIAPVPGPTTHPVAKQATVKTLESDEGEQGAMLGKASELTLTLTGSATPKLTTVQFVTPAGNDLYLARDDALRFIRLSYPNWYIAKGEITFEDKYVAHDGGSIGTALGTLIVSCIAGVEIDPDVAITGDISANGKTRAVSGVAAKIKGAIAGKCTIAAIPIDNLDQLVDAVIFNGPELVTNVQVIGITDLDDALAKVRTDRDSNLTQAIALFARVQKLLKEKPDAMTSGEVQAKLRQVLALEPNHLSAQVLLSIAAGTQPKTLSADASRYYTFLSVSSMVDAVRERDDSSGAPSVPSILIRSGLSSLRMLRPMADQSVRPLIDAWIRYLGTLNQVQEGLASPQAVEEQRQALLDQMATENVDADLMDRILKAGM